MKIAYLLIAVFLVSCVPKTAENPILTALEADNKAIHNVMKQLEKHEVQIMLTDADGNDFTYQVNDSDYFYPASSVKFPIALLALEKVQEIDEIDASTSFLIAGDSTKTTVRDEIRKIFAVSDNEAYNRLFELLGQDEIAQRLAAKGLQPARISHRVGTVNADTIRTKAVTFYKNDSIVYKIAPKLNATVQKLTLNRIQKGNGFYQNDSLIVKQMDFSRKNYLPIRTLHEMMLRLQFPENYTEAQQFHIADSDREFLLNTMHQTPEKQGYEKREYYDSYVKFFLFGDSKESIPDHIKIYNKVGYAYGYLTDCAHIVDEENDIRFTITATIHVNENRIFNDDTYEYETIGIPFLAALGGEIHQFYLNKNHK